MGRFARKAAMPRKGIIPEKQWGVNPIISLGNERAVLKPGKVFHTAKKDATWPPMLKSGERCIPKRKIPQNRWVLRFNKTVESRRNTYETAGGTGESEPANGTQKGRWLYLMYKPQENKSVENSVESVEKRRKIPSASSAAGGKPGGKGEKLPCRLNGPPKHDTIKPALPLLRKTAQGRISDCIQEA